MQDSTFIGHLSRSIAELVKGIKRVSEKFFRAIFILESDCLAESPCTPVGLSASISED
jgi:hypothetical protein